MTDHSTGRAGRRGFLTATTTVLGGLALWPRAARGDARDDDGPLVHPEDAWMDALPRGHRMVFDAATMSGAAHAGLFAGNFIGSNISGYGLRADQLGVIVVLRHLATAFAFTDTIWGTYPQLARRLELEDPATGQLYAKNPFLHPGLYEGPTMGVRWADLLRQGVHFIVCGGATRNFSAMIARDTGQKAEDVRAELLANQIGNAHQMATGILGFSRAQEKGYTASVCT